jgi:hypothetical protein
MLGKNLASYQKRCPQSVRTGDTEVSKQMLHENSPLDSVSSPVKPTSIGFVVGVGSSAGWTAVVMEDDADVLSITDSTPCSWVVEAVGIVVSVTPVASVLVTEVKVMMFPDSDSAEPCEDDHSGWGLLSLKTDDDDERTAVDETWSLSSSAVVNPLSVSSPCSARVDGNVTCVDDVLGWCLFLRTDAAFLPALAVAVAAAMWLLSMVFLGCLGGAILGWVVNEYDFSLREDGVKARSRGMKRRNKRKSVKERAGGELQRGSGLDWKGRMRH